jgi:hypothetical protein
MKFVWMTGWAAGLLLAVGAAMASAQVKDLKIDPESLGGGFLN